MRSRECNDTRPSVGMFARSLEEPRLLSLRGAREGLVAHAWITKPRPTMLGHPSFAKLFFREMLLRDVSRKFFVAKVFSYAVCGLAALSRLY